MKTRTRAHTHLDARDCEIWDLKVDSDGWPALQLVILHAGEPKMSPHQELLSSLETQHISK